MFVCVNVCVCVRAFVTNLLKMQCCPKSDANIISVYKAFSQGIDEPTRPNNRSKRHCNVRVHVSSPTLIQFNPLIFYIVY